MRKVLMIAAIALIAVACNKNQAAVKKLDGTWNATSIIYTEEGAAGSVDLMEAGFVTSATYIFDGCKLKEDDFCNVVVTFVTPSGSITTEDLYSVTNDGETLQTKDDPSSETVNDSTIDELTRSTLKITSVDSDDNKTVTTLEKQ